MQFRKLILTVSVFLLVIAFFVFNRRESTSNERIPRSPADQHNRGETFNRNSSNIIYTKHALCRMACRQIDKREIAEILKKGRINHEKSDPASRPDPKYALEGYTQDGQEVRIIFAQANERTVVVTVIDLQKEWSCNCK